jgi:hypothetical protein
MRHGFLSSRLHGKACGIGIKRPGGAQSSQLVAVICIQVPMLEMNRLAQKSL